jgi:hypothetical protein
MPDGQSFLLDSRRDVAPTAITVMVGWTAGLSLPNAPPDPRAVAVASR